MPATSAAAAPGPPGTAARDRLWCTDRSPPIYAFLVTSTGNVPSARARTAAQPLDAALPQNGRRAKKGTIMTALIRPGPDRLRTGFRGELISPGADGYETARKVWNGAIDRHPALIARAACTADVVAAVGFARERGLPVSIRGGGHSAAGLAVAEGALMLDLSAMKTIRIDPAARTAVAGPGLLWRELDAATQAFGLATTGGVVGSTGIAGLTLGGGIGWLDRLAGLTCDNLLGAEIVTADGRVLHATGDAHPDLFWALCGGGGNFGVVTSFTYRLHPVPEAYGGLLGYTIDRAAEVLQAYRKVGGDAPGRTSRGRGPPGTRRGARRPAAATSTSSEPTRAPTGSARHTAATSAGWHRSRPPTTPAISSTSTTTSGRQPRRRTGSEAVADAAG